MDGNQIKFEMPEDPFRLIVESAPNAILMIEANGAIVVVNSQAERMFGYARDELIGRAVEILVPDRHQTDHHHYRQAYLNDPESRAMGAGRDLFGRRKDGTEFPVEIGLNPVKTPQGVFVLAAILDITERKRIEQTLAEQERFLQTIFDTEPECVKLLGPGGVLLKINRAGLDMLEVETAELVEGHCVYSMVAPEHREAFQTLTECVFQGETGTLEFDCLGQRGARRSLETHAVPLHDAEGKVTAALCITRDITDKKRAEDRARQAERLATIGQVVTGLAHESRNALQRSQAALELLELEVGEEAEALELVGRIQRAQNHLQQLFDEVRNYAAPIILDRTACTLPEIWREAWTLLAASRESRGATLHETVSVPDVACRVDRFRLIQVFRNLLENSLAACQDPVRITIACEAADPSDRDMIRLTLRDNGPGLDSDARQRVFEPFFTTKTKGTGLGMAIAQRFVDAHGGTIEMGKSQTAGAEFVITMPRGV